MSFNCHLQKFSVVHSDRLKHAYLKLDIRRGLMGVYSHPYTCHKHTYSWKTNVVMTCLIFLMCRLSWLQGVLFVTDFKAHRVREIDIASQRVTTLAGYA
jgi:hypothetical protein